MKKALVSKNNTASFKKFLIPKNEDTDDQNWVEIEIDFTNQVFTARKIIVENPDNEWEFYNDYTFPSSLFNQFIAT